ncbi:MAG: hypothetical protein IJM27_03625 [Eubacterium sp.]|nr:hypothetical protein [Eubacterium sp.]
MKRTISKRVELNENEAKVLRMKSEQCGLSEAEFIRELLMGSQPMEAPPRQFYEAMATMSQVVSMIQDVIQNGENTFPEEMQEFLRTTYAQLVSQVVAIKELVSKARFFDPDEYVMWEHEVKMAEKEGRAAPTLDEYLSDRAKRVIRHPATDVDLGWNALGITPPFLHPEDERNETATGVDGWQNIEEHTDSKGQKASVPQSTGQDGEAEDISAYADMNVLRPPQKESDY